MSQSLTRVGVGRLCELFGKTRHAYYDMLWHKQERWNDEQFIVELLLDLQREIPRLSSRKIHQLLNPTLLAYDIKIGWNRLHEIRGKHHLLCQQKKHYVATTDANHRFRKYPNIIRGLEVVRPEQVWVSDITLYTGRRRFLFFIPGYRCVFSLGGRLLSLPNPGSRRHSYSPTNGNWYASPEANNTPPSF